MGDMSINHGCTDDGMTKQLLDCSNVFSLFQEVWRDFALNCQRGEEFVHAIAPKWSCRNLNRVSCNSFDDFKAINAESVAFPSSISACIETPRYDNTINMVSR